MDNAGKREHCNGCQHFIYWYPYETPYCRLAEMREIPYPRPESPVRAGELVVFDACAPKPTPEWCPLEDKC